MENCNVTYPGISTWNPQMKMVKRVTKTIDKYDCEGRYLGREIITEEYEDVYVQDWSQPYIGDITYQASSALSIN